jgi:hypothetical protein
VLVTPVAGTLGSAAAVLAAVATSPQVPAGWVDELGENKGVGSLFIDLVAGRH